MKIIEANYPGGPVPMYIDASLTDIGTLNHTGKTVIITDENIFSLHGKRFSGYPVIQIKSGEENKTQAAVDRIIDELLELNIDRSDMLIGAGGGVVTDIAGYAASIFKRGIRLGLAPTTILGMTDAAIGGKNGVNAGIYKNMVGTIHQPQFILYDWAFLETLPEAEYINGFAEIIKHACIKDAAMFNDLQEQSPGYYLRNKPALASLIEENILIKTDVVINDEHETGARYLLNFGHSFGHAIENLYQLPHGHAISIGMIIAAKVSEELTGFSSRETAKLAALLKQYGLPVSLEINREKVLDLLLKDKKKQGDTIHFVLLRDIGEAIVQQISFDTLRPVFEKIVL